MAFKASAAPATPHPPLLPSLLAPAHLSHLGFPEPFTGSTPAGGRLSHPDGIHGSPGCLLQGPFLGAPPGCPERLSVLPSHSTHSTALVCVLICLPLDSKFFQGENQALCTLFHPGPDPACAWRVCAEGRMKEYSDRVFPV